MVSDKETSLPKNPPDYDPGLPPTGHLPPPEEDRMPEGLVGLPVDPITRELNSVLFKLELDYFKTNDPDVKEQIHALQKIVDKRNGWTD